MYKKVLITSTGEYLDELIENALAIINQEGMEISGLYVVDDSAPFLTPKKVKQLMVDELNKKGEKVLNIIGKKLSEHAHYQIEYKPLLVEGDPAKEIIEVAQEKDVDIIVMGTGKSKIDKHLLGSVSEKVVHSSPCTILLVRIK